jgi:hypothetical protein
LTTQLLTSKWTDIPGRSSRSNITHRSLFRPTDGVRKYAIFGEPSFSQIVTGKVKLQFVIRLAYKGPGDKAYGYSEKSQYDPSINKFLS